MISDPTSIHFHTFYTQLSLSTQILGFPTPDFSVFQHGFPREVPQEKLHHGSNELGRDSVTPRPLLGLSEPWLPIKSRISLGFFIWWSKEIAKNWNWPFYLNLICFVDWVSHNIQTLYNVMQSHAIWIGHRIFTISKRIGRLASRNA